MLYKYIVPLTLSSFPVAFCVIDGSPGKERKGKQKLNEIYPLFRDMTIMTQLKDMEFCEVCFLVYRIIKMCTFFLVCNQFNVV